MKTISYCKPNSARSVCYWSIEASDLQLQENYKVIAKVFYFLDLDKVANIEAKYIELS